MEWRIVPRSQKKAPARRYFGLYSCFLSVLFVYSIIILNFAGTNQRNFLIMTAVQLNAMNTELWQSIGAIADSEQLMRRLTRYAKKLVKEKEDSTLMTKEEFFRRIDEAKQEIADGKGRRFSDLDEMNAWLNSL